MGPIATIDPEALIARLRAPGFRLDLGAATAARDRAAALLSSDPSQAYRISSALLYAARSSPSEGGTDPEVRAVAWRCHAEACLYTGHLPEAENAYQAAASEAERAGADALLGQILVGRVALLGLLGKSAEAIESGRRAGRILRRTEDHAYLGKLHMNLGNIHYHHERYDEAYDAYRRARAMLERSGARDATSVGLAINEAIACAHLSRVAEARSLFLHAEETCSVLGLEHLRAEAVFNRALLERLRGDYRAALSMLEDAFSVFSREGGNDMVAATARAQAEIYLELGMAREALDLGRASAEAFGREEMIVDEMISRLHEARALLQLDQPETAGAVLTRIEEFYRTRRVRPRRGAALLIHAQAHLSLDRMAEARTATRQALRIFEDHDMRQQSSEAHRLLAEIHLARGLPRRAERALAPAIALSRMLPPGERFEVWMLAGRISFGLGERREGLRRLRRAVRFLERQRRLIPGVEFRARAFDRQIAAYHSLIAWMLESRHPSFRSIYSLVETALGRGFRERSASVGRRVRDDLGEKRADLGSVARRLEEMQLRASPNEAAISTLRRTVRDFERQIEALVRRAEAREPSLATAKHAKDPAAVAACLGPDEILIEYFVLDDGAFALVLGRDVRAVRRLPGDRAALRSAVDNLRALIGTMSVTAGRPFGSAEFFRRSADAFLERLYRIVLAPLRDLLPDPGRLTIVPHGILHEVPFESLFDGARYVDASWVVARAPTADSIVRRRRKPSPKRRVLVAGVIAAGPESVQSEIQAVVEALHAEDVLVLRDPTAPELLREMARHDVVHLATHGSFRSDNPAFSRLSAKEGAVFLADILDTPLSAELVSLSACGTGQVFSGRGDDLIGVAHAFLAAGARQLLASLWRVHDRATNELMSAFYQSYAGEAWGDPAAALRTAARAVRDRRDHPFYWGGFCVYGA